MRYYIRALYKFMPQYLKYWTWISNFTSRKNCIYWKKNFKYWVSISRYHGWISLIWTSTIQYQFFLCADKTSRKFIIQNFIRFQPEYFRVIQRTVKHLHVEKCILKSRYSNRRYSSIISRYWHRFPLLCVFYYYGVYTWLR